MYANAHNDTECITCPFRTSPCQAVLRTVIALSDGRYCSIDLATSSARNLMRLDDELSKTDIPVQARYLILTVTPRKTWGEVRFEVDDSGR